MARQITLFVTYPGGSDSVITVGRDGDESNPRAFKVQIPYLEGEQWAETCTRAVTKSRSHYKEYLAQRHAIVSVPDPQVVEVIVEPKRVFDPEEVMPFVDQMLGRLIAIAHRPLRIELSGHGTASTDCRSHITFNPDPFERGQIEAGFGRGFHEVGHVRYDVDGSRKDKPRRFGEPAIGIEMMERAFNDGGEQLKNTLNLIMDRRADDLQCKEFPGNANALRHRMADLMPGERTLPDGRVIKTPNGKSLKCVESVFIDFAYAVKKRTRPSHTVVRKCINLVNRAIRRVNKGQRKYVELLRVSKEVVALLRVHMLPLDEEQQQQQEKLERLEAEFNEFMKALAKAIHGDKIDADMRKAFRRSMARRLKTKRRQSYQKLPQTMRNVSQRVSAGGRGVGGGPKGNIIHVPRNPKAYAPLVPQARAQAGRLSAIIRRLSVPDPRILRGLDRGEFDIDALSVLASGRSDCMKIDLQAFKLDLAMAILEDVSASMKGHGADKLAVTFNEALMGHRSVDSQFFAFNNNVYVCGPARRNNGIAGVKPSGGTLEYFGVQQAGGWLRESRRSRKVLLTICDGGPFHPELVRNEVNELVRRGIVPIRVLVGVDVAPKTYPIELFFDSWSEFYRELEQLFGAIIRAARV